jgi:hypothetical protein
MSQEKSGPGRNPKDPAENRPDANAPGKSSTNPSNPNKPIVTPPPASQQNPVPGQSNRPEPFGTKKQDAPKEDLIGAAADEEEEEEQEE